MESVSETNRMRQIMMDIGRYTKTIVFRNNVGTGWQGKIQKTDRGIHIEGPRPLHAGLCKGSSDLIGWTPVTITPEMVGTKVAVFTAIEVKKTKTSNISKDQLNFLQNVKKAGGIAGVAVDSMESVNIIKNG